jgi:hypothetical protein
MHVCFWARERVGFHALLRCQHFLGSTSAASTATSGSAQCGFPLLLVRIIAYHLAGRCLHADVGSAKMRWPLLLRQHMCALIPRQFFLIGGVRGFRRAGGGSFLSRTCSAAGTLGSMCRATRKHGSRCPNLQKCGCILEQSL